MIPPSEEICGKLTLGTQFWRVHSVGYTTLAVADSTGLSSFGLLLLPPKAAKSREILWKFELIAVQGHPRSSIAVSIESALRICNFLLIIKSNFVFGRIS